MDTAGSGDPPPGEHRLNLQNAGDLPDRPAVYAAWIVDQAALSDAGIEGPEPVLMYVGKTTSLRRRLRRHAQWPWLNLIDLLASRGTVLPAWWSYSEKNIMGSTAAAPPLLAITSLAQALAWQEKNVRWGWITDPAVGVGALESRLTKAHRPLLDRSGQGYPARLPVQLRRIGPYEKERAWWLFHVSWLAVLTLKPIGWLGRAPSYRPAFWESYAVACDDDGWPVPLNKGTVHETMIPEDWTAREILVEVAPSELLEAVADSSTGSEEAAAWSAAYAGHQFLRNSEPHEETLRAALSGGASAYRAPTKLPSGPKLDELLDLIKPLPHLNK